MTEGYLRNLQIVRIMPIGQCRPMFDSLLLLVTATFLLAGFVKGALGLGLPTVSMGLLAVSMPPAQAIAIVIVPAIVTNIWQTFGGPYLRDIFRRLWPMLTGTAAGIWLNAGSLTGPYARYTTIALGLLLAINAIIGLSKFNFTVARRNEKWVGGIVGLITGMISAATGVQVVPSVPFLQAIGMEKEELIQALGVFFTVATLALGLNLTGAGLLTGDLIPIARAANPPSERTEAVRAQPDPAPAGQDTTADCVRPAFPLPRRAACWTGFGRQRFKLLTLTRSRVPPGLAGLAMTSPRLIALCRPGRVTPL